MRVKKSAKKASPNNGNGKKPAKKSGVKLSSGRTNEKKPVRTNGNHGIKKQYPKAGDSCNVTFRLPKEAAPHQPSFPGGPRPHPRRPARDTPRSLNHSSNTET